MISMKLFKLWVHQKCFSDYELVINPKEFPLVKVGDILEIFHPDDDSSHLLLQVKSLQTELQQKGKDIISIDQAIATLFQLRAYKDVQVCQVTSPQDVSLDLVELIFKDQYISRSDMWRLKNSLVGSCAYLSKKVEFSGIRAQVNELWSKGVKVMCGAVTEDTRVAFRSSTAMVYMLIQMSSEMWDFNAHGDLLWEKAVNGFVAELFGRWKDKNSTNEVTIVFFSRRYYHTDSVDNFPENMQQCLHVDYRGRIYQDFYRVIVQNERRDDWTSLLVSLKSHCIDYGRRQDYSQHNQDSQLPASYISNSAEGNFLEALNLSLNVFDKHYINRNFDRTGQVIVVVTPGAGVFEVDRQLYKITKQRMIDNGEKTKATVDLQLRKYGHEFASIQFHSLDPNPSTKDNNIPHWLNHSFYTAKNQLHKCCIYSGFTPRIKLAGIKGCSKVHQQLPRLSRPPEDRCKSSQFRTSPFKTSKHDEDYMCDEHDADIFKAPSHVSPKPRTPLSFRPSKLPYKTLPNLNDKDVTLKQPFKRTKTDVQITNTSISTDLAEPFDNQGSSHFSTAIPIPERSNHLPPSVSVTAALKQTCVSRSVGATQSNHQPPNEDHLHYPCATVGSANIIHDKTSTSPNHQIVYKTLINPFASLTMAVKLTSNRRRWTHTFPAGPSGEIMQPHHHFWTTNEHTDYPLSTPVGLSESVSVPLISSPTQQPPSRLLPIPMVIGGMRGSGSGSSLASEAGSVSGLHNGQSRSVGFCRFSPGGDLPRNLVRSTSGVWGVTGEQEWSPFIQTGMDWKSLTATACFPITTDYFPENQIVEKQFVENNYELIADETNEGASEWQHRSEEAIFQELISQRLMQGFQLVVLPKSVLAMLQSRRSKDILVTDTNRHEYVLSIGRIFHKLVLQHQRGISVTVYKPRHSTITHAVYYNYQLWSPHNAGYQPSTIIFQSYPLESFNWNYLDNYVSSRGVDFGPIESLKLWRSRFLLIPAVSSKMKRSLDDPAAYLDLFKEFDGREEAHQLTEGFVKFLEALNRLRRHYSGSRKTKAGSFSKSVTPPKPCDPRCHHALHPSTTTTTTATTTNNVVKTSAEVCSKVSEIVGTPQHTSKNETEEVEADGPGSHLTEDDDFKLTLCSPLSEITKAMRDTTEGINFLSTDLKRLPANCFVAHEAVNWLRSSLGEDVSESEAVELLQNMTASGLMCHASGNPHHPFWNGFMLYYFVKEDSYGKDNSKMSSPSKKSSSSNYPIGSKFHNEWMEVASVPCSKEHNRNIPLFLLPQLTPLTNQPITFLSSFTNETMQDAAEPTDLGFVKDVYYAAQPSSLKSLLFDNHTNNKTNRIEWCHLNYDGCYVADMTWGFQVEWLVSTPSLLLEVLQGWARKAVQCGFHLVPAPMDAFNNCPHFSNPLSSPRFISINEQCLMDQRLFKVFDTDTLGRRLHLLQEAILKRFGFLKALDPCHLSPISLQHSPKDQIQYIHITGMVLVRIVQLPASQVSTICDMPPSLTTPISGFQWVPNYLLSKRWRTSSTGDEKFPDRLLNDFTRFCQNNEDRLRLFLEMNEDTYLPKILQ